MAARPILTNQRSLGRRLMRAGSLTITGPGNIASINGSIHVGPELNRTESDTVRTSAATTRSIAIGECVSAGTSEEATAGRG